MDGWIVVTVSVEAGGSRTCISSCSSVSTVLYMNTVGTVNVFQFMGLEVRNCGETNRHGGHFVSDGVPQYTTVGWNRNRPSVFRSTGVVPD